MVNIPPLNQISQQQANLYETYFRQVNPSGTGTIGAAEAATFLKKSGLPEGVLHTIWDLSDQGSKGYLDKKGFYIALKLISLAQGGKDVSINSLAIPTSPPRMGESPRGVVPREQASKTDTTSWGIKAKEKLQYDNIFDSLSPNNGLLCGDKVKPVLLKSKLPVDVLGKIWDISDIDQDGSLDRDEFSVAMHLVYRALDGEVVPATLPLILVPPSKRKLPISHTVISSVNQPAAQRNSSPAPVDKQWVILPADKAKYHHMFLQADSDKDGLVSGGEIKDILLASALPQPMLAHIWSMCDKNNTGLLNTDQFSFAMHLISLVKSGKELPNDVSAEMITPSSQATPSHPPLQSKPSIDLANISLESSSSDFSAIKELDQITTEIEALGREKASLQREISETEEAIRNRKLEIEDLQNELLKGNKGIDLLNEQKAQSQSQLDSLDSEKTKYEEQYNEIQIKIQEEKQVLNQLRTQYKSQQDSCKVQEVELQKARKELDKVRKEESDLELELENNKNELESLKEKVSRTKSETAEVQSKINKLSEENNLLKEEIVEYTTTSNNLQNGSTHLTELNENFETRFKDVDQISARATAGSSPVSSISGFSGSGGGRDDEENDDFKDTDPFKSNKDDPFGGNDSDNIDPFISDDPFKSDPFKQVSFADPFSGDPFQDNDPFKDPFKEISGDSDINKPSQKEGSIGRDPFSALDPFGSGAFVTTNAGKSAFSSGTAKSIESNSSDPFSNGNLFSASGSLADISPETDSDQPATVDVPDDPFKSDPFVTKDADDLFTTGNKTDPFASGDDNDPFGAQEKTDPFASEDNKTDHFTAEDNETDPFASEDDKTDPFADGSKTDPFAAGDKNDNFITGDNTDPFASGGKSDPFASGDPFTVSQNDDPFSSSSTAPLDDPFSSKDPTNDPFSSSSTDPFSCPANDPFSTPVNLGSDPFASEVVSSSDDPFCSSNIATDSNDPWFAFSDASFINTTKTKEVEKPPSPKTQLSEENQLEWAKRESEREETERKKRLKELQDQEEMQIAIALKHSVESSSDA